MSKDDSSFFNVFSLVLGILVVITVLLFALARTVGGDTQRAYLKVDPRLVADTAKRVEPLGRVAVAGGDNSGLDIVPAVGAVIVALNVPTDGPSTYEAVCSACHAGGIGGAPKAGDKGLWAPRIAQGKATLYQHAIVGYAGKAGVMPAKGGRTDLSDELIQASVDHMVSLAQ